MSKISKKASANIISLVQSIDHNASKLTSYDEAWDIISEYCNITGGLYTQHNSKQSLTIFDIISESTNETIHSIEWQNKEVFADGDWDWTKIFKEVLEYLIKNKLVKKPRKKKTQITPQISQQKSKMNKLSSKEKLVVKSQENSVKLNSTKKRSIKNK